MRKYTNEIIGSISMIYVVKKYHAYLSVYQFIECSIGYSGDNCSVVCPSDSYGKLCSQTCDSHCISCHHIFGCNVTEETTGNTFEIKVFFFIILSFERKSNQKFSCIKNALCTLC